MKEQEAGQQRTARHRGEAQGRGQRAARQEARLLGQVGPESHGDHVLHTHA